MFGFGQMMKQAVEQMRRKGVDPLVLEAQANRPSPPPEDKIIIGLDVGEVKDFTALNALQMSRRPDADGKTRRHYVSRLLHRWPLRTGYEQIIEDIRQIASKLPIVPTLVLDATGAGRPVAQMFRRAKLPVKSFVPVIITGGTGSKRDEDGYWHVAKRELVSCVLAASQSRRLKISPKLREAKTLIRELQRFRCKINIATGNESFEAWRERDHDDMVLATALALWHSENLGRELRADMFLFP
ncbi:MAG TPA: hypothetical protein VMG10_27405 [Gemmataceae bacterium]|nr:hypothetical protein [Gemmataceae bacterium]